MIETPAKTSAVDTEPILTTTDCRYFWALDLNHPGYAPEVGELVHIRESRGYAVRGLHLDLQHGNLTPTPYEVVEVIPAHDVEMDGGTGHWATQYVCRNTTITSFDFDLTVPAFRLVKAETPATSESE